MNYIVETELETDGRWIAEVVNLLGEIAYGKTKAKALAKTQALALRVEADMLDNGERSLFDSSIFFNAA